MLSYEKHFKSQRADGRHISTMAALMEQMRKTKPELTLPEELTPESFAEWQKKVKEKIRELLCLPEATPQPAPVLLSRAQREGYSVEKWEFYPDDYTAVPFLALIPDDASAEHPVPAVLCFLGSNHSKEFAAGEEMLDHPNGQAGRFPERNCMAKHIVKARMAAFVFDNPGIGECSVLGDPEKGEQQHHSRVQACFGYLQMGMNYVGISVFQKLRFLEHLKTLNYVDQNKIAVSSHSLGTETAIVLGLLCDEIKAIVFNDYMGDDLRRYVSLTEVPEDRMEHDIGNWHIIPGSMRYFTRKDWCAAFAPRYLGLTEGGSDESIEEIRRAYAVCGAEENLLVSYYPAYADPATHTMPKVVPDHGLSQEEYFAYHYVIPEDHSFRSEPALRLLSKLKE